MNIAQAVDATRNEVERAMRLHSGMASRHDAYAVILEEVDEFWDLVKKNPAKMSSEQVEHWNISMRDELLQIAAMAIRAVCDLGL